MELDNRIAIAFQAQMNRELVASLTYKQMETDFSLAGWKGFETFMKKSGEEELTHYAKIRDFLVERQTRPLISTIQIAPVLYSSTSPIQYFQSSLKLEELFWNYFNEIYRLGDEEDDYDACIFTHWFIQEQHSSVDELSIIIQRLGRAGIDNAALLEIDEEFLED